MHAAKGILTARGGMTSHAAVVARGMGRPCVSGAGGISIDAKTKRRAKSLISKLVILKHDLGDLGFHKTAHALESAVKTIGYEFAEKLEAK